MNDIYSVSVIPNIPANKTPCIFKFVDVNSKGGKIGPSSP